MKTRNATSRNSFSSAFFTSAMAFTLMDFGGQVYPFWMNSSLCFKYLGCNAGFFGYDALLHAVSGFAAIFLFLWLCERYPKSKLLPERPFSRIVVLMALVALVGVCWEISEYIWDQYRIITNFHPNLLHPFQRGQSSNADTMGDLIFNLVGASFSLAFLKLRAIFPAWRLNRSRKESTVSAQNESAPAYVMRVD